MPSRFRRPAPRPAPELSETGDSYRALIPGPRGRWRQRLVARAVAEVLPSGVVLDVGCGRGGFPYALGALPTGPYSVYGVDADALHVSAARRDCDGMGGDLGGKGSVVACNFCLARAEALPLRASTAAAVVVGEVLEHLADDRAAVAEAARVLEPGGVLVATVPAGPRRFGPRDRRAGHQRRYSAESLERLLLGAGFEVVEIRGWGYPLGRMYEALVQGPVLGRRVIPDVAVEIAGSAHAGRIVGALFELDTVFPQGAHSAGWLAVARH